MKVTEPPLRKDSQQPQHRIPSKTTQYHAQLYSEQKRLQNQLLQQTMLPSSSGSSSSTHTDNATNVKKDNNESMAHISLPTLTFETPNLYRTSLKLSKDINIHSWWATVVGLLTDNSFRASRVTLCVPQDSSDPYSGPWGLKAVYDINSNNNNNNDITTTNNEMRINDHQQDTTVQCNENENQQQGKIYIYINVYDSIFSLLLSFFFL